MLLSNDPEYLASEILNESEQDEEAVDEEETNSDDSAAGKKS